MNFLAHLLMGSQSPQQALGSLLGDFVKGPVQQIALPEEVRGGIWLHRRIDVFTDSHPLVLQSKARISPARRRFAGIMVDMFYDHLLARHWEQFADLPLAEFSQQSYRYLLQHPELIPANAWPVIRHMSENDWLGSYAQLPHLHRALDNMARRLRRDNSLPGAVTELEADYLSFEADFLGFMPDVQRFASDQAARLNAGSPDLLLPSARPSA
ncbi:MAG: ACP phosphodiesterase [Halopseudomonas sp.]|uniref:acyl carrier protein phosphodiesterase n=1 Tax=Halopseudomonas sp. TaxID=2901191 RepID=UPI003003011F